MWSHKSNLSSRMKWKKNVDCYFTQHPATNVTFLQTHCKEKKTIPNHQFTLVFAKVRSQWIVLCGMTFSLIVQTHKMMSLISFHFCKAAKHNHVLYLVFYNAWKVIPNVIIWQTSAHTSLIKMAFCIHVEMGVIWTTVMNLNATTNSNVSCLTAYHGCMCVMANGIVQMVMMNTITLYVVQTKFVWKCLNVAMTLPAYI